MSRTDRTTWPEVLTRTDLATVYAVSTKTIDRMRAVGALPEPMPAPRRGQPRWSKTDLCKWLDNAALREKGWRRVA